MLKHDPERDAAAYVNGELSVRRRRRFESHLVGCEDCWREVTAARAGRAIAEAGREQAPTDLRERVRAVIGAAPVPGPQRWLVAAWSVSSAALLLIVSLVLIGGRKETPDVISEVIRHFDAGIAGDAPTSSALPVRLGHLKLVDAGRTVVAGRDLSVHRYGDRAGSEIAVYQGSAPFERPEGAESAGGPRWMLRTGDAIVFCSDDPVPSLVVGREPGPVLHVASELGLR